MSARPVVGLVSWYHNSRLLQHNKSAGTILTGHSLALQVTTDTVGPLYCTAHLQRIGRGHAGNYSCSATNTVGRGNSTSVNLDVKCKFLLIQTRHLP